MRSSPAIALTAFEQIESPRPKPVRSPLFQSSEKMPLTAPSAWALQPCRAMNSPSRDPTPSRKSILVVDDDEDVRTAIYEALSPQYRIILAADGLEGYEKAHEHPSPDLIIADIAMPRLDGLSQRVHLSRRTSTHPVHPLPEEGAHPRWHARCWEWEHEPDPLRGIPRSRRGGVVARCGLLLASRPGRPRSTPGGSP